MVDPRHTNEHRRARAALKARARFQHCFTCGRELDATKPRGHPDAITLGHIIAIEDGGDPFDPDNHDAQCAPCNYGDGQRRSTRNRIDKRAALEPAANRNRLVVILCGPSGAGKTTAAKQSGLPVYDRDDPRWRNSEAAFIRAIEQLGRTPNARAVIIRAAPTSEARAKWRRLANATHVYLIDPGQAECASRIIARSRNDVRNTIASLPDWYARFDRRDGVQTFPGWSSVVTGRGPAAGPAQVWVNPHLSI